MRVLKHTIYFVFKKEREILYLIPEVYPEHNLTQEHPTSTNIEL